MAKSDLKKIEVEYKNRLPIYEKLSKEAMYILVTELDKNPQIKIHDKNLRVKKLDSFLKKVNRKESEDPFKDIQDLVGIRIVCLFLSDIPKIKAIIEKSFDLLSEDNKIDNSDVSSFGYMSNHLIVSIKEECSGPRYKNIVGLPFEIQVRTIAQHSWATISHYLDYKTETAVPKKLLKDFHALSALFYIADIHFEMFMDESNKSKAKMNNEFKKVSPNLDQDINLDSLRAYLKMRFPNREHSDSIFLSILISEIYVIGYTKILQIDNVVERAMKAVLQYENERLSPSTGVRLVDVGIIRTALILVDENYAKTFGSGETYAKYRSLI